MQFEALPLPEPSSLKQHKITWAIIAISCVPLFILITHDINTLNGWFFPLRITDLADTFQVWRLWTPVFVHYTALHLFTNAYLWWCFASHMESRSIINLILFTLVTALITNLSQYWWAGPNFGGLSGVVYAFLGFHLVQYYYWRNAEYRVNPVLAIILLALIPLYASGAFGKFSNAAHISGLLSGALIASLPGVLRRKNLG